MSIDDTIELGYSLAFGNTRATPSAWRRIASEIDGSFDALWLGEHIIVPEAGFDRDDYNPTWAEITTELYEVFQTLSYLAGQTTDIHLGTNICIAPARHPVHLTKQVLTLEAISDGRMEFGVAPGGMKSELEVLDIPFEERGPRTDEFLELFHEVMEQGELSFDGQYHQSNTSGFYPIPDRNDGPRVWIGGNSGATFRRIAEYGDGWISSPFTNPEALRDGRDRLQQAWTDYNRTASLQIAATQEIFIGSPNEIDRPTPGVIVGSPNEIIEAIESYIDSGATFFTIKSPVSTSEQEITQIRRFCDDVLPAFR